LSKNNEEEINQEKSQKDAELEFLFLERAEFIFE